MSLELSPSDDDAATPLDEMPTLVLRRLLAVLPTRSLVATSQTCTRLEDIAVGDYKYLLGQHKACALPPRSRQIQMRIELSNNYAKLELWSAADRFTDRVYLVLRDPSYTIGNVISLLTEHRLLSHMLDFDRNQDEFVITNWEFCEENMDELLDLRRGTSCALLALSDVDFDESETAARMLSELQPRLLRLDKVSEWTHDWLVSDDFPNAVANHAEILDIDLRFGRLLPRSRVLSDDEGEFDFVHILRAARTTEVSLRLGGNNRQLVQLVRAWFDESEELHYFEAEFEPEPHSEDPFWPVAQRLINDWPLAAVGHRYMIVAREWLEGVLEKLDDLGVPVRGQTNVRYNLPVVTANQLHHGRVFVVMTLEDATMTVTHGFVAPSHKQEFLGILDHESYAFSVAGRILYDNVGWCDNGGWFIRSELWLKEKLGAGNYLVKFEAT